MTTLSKAFAISLAAFALTIGLVIIAPVILAAVVDGTFKAWE